MFKFSLWGKGLAAALIGGASTAAINAVADPAALAKPKELATMAGVGAVIGGLSYLKTHPPVDAAPDALEPLAAAGVAMAADTISARITKRKP